MIAYTNPFNADTNLSFDLVAPSNIDINVYDINGKHIKNIISSQLMAPNPYTVTIDMDGYSTGLYFIEISNEQSTLTKQILYLK